MNTLLKMKKWLQGLTKKSSNKKTVSKSRVVKTKSPKRKASSGHKKR